jgi:formate dehydrogenase iron-sulfur subunit
MVQIARSRVSQLQKESGFANAGVYDPQSIGGTHVIYVLHDVTQTELYGGLPSNPVIPPSYTVWKWLAKPTGLLMAALGVFAVFFHRIAVGPKLPRARAQPEAVPIVTEHPDEAAAAEKEKP